MCLPRCGRAAGVAMRRGCTALMLVLGLATAARAASPPDIRGVYVITNPYFVATGSVAAALDVPGVDGLLIHLFWNDITKPARKEVYDWGFLDTAVKMALAAGKTFELGIVTGGSTPAWVYAKPPGGLGGVARAFPFEDGSGACTTLTMTAPF